MPFSVIKCWNKDNDHELHMWLDTYHNRVIKSFFEVTQSTNFLVVFRCPQYYKNNGMTPIGIRSQGPSQSIVKVFSKNWDVVRSFVYLVIIKNACFVPASSHVVTSPLYCAYWLEVLQTDKPLLPSSGCTEINYMFLHSSLQVLGPH